MYTEQSLTRRQQEIYEFLVEHHLAFSRPPTLDELCGALGMKSRGSLHKQIQALVDAGLIEPANGKQRGIRLTEPARQSEHRIPMMGFIAAGHPIEAIENPEWMDIPDMLKGQGSCYVLQVKGDSMVDDGILDGDWVVIERRTHARDGEIVVALIEGMDATLKHIEQRPGEIILHPANSSMESMRYPTDRVEIQGVLVGQMRSYRNR
ncbi:MAG: transcriptional repressor LexA [Methylococcaceae bacterium]|nr:transcriptional repressor LexA [Methylococcaceae bacterium]MCI0668183.1 transcriptional repressor LexA [Methylococcaceae bacterium]MCI0733704.1 transcriptional repressor LexA [Methylococcaceae bacterium]